MVLRAALSPKLQPSVGMSLVHHKLCSAAVPKYLLTRARCFHLLKVSPWAAEVGREEGEMQQSSTWDRIA